MFTILCPTDFSEVANNAVAYASEIAKLVKGRLHLTHIVFPSYVALDSNGVFLTDMGTGAKAANEFQNNANNKLMQLAEDLKSTGRDVTYSTEHGFWDSVLNDLHNRIKPDLLVSGTKGAGSIFEAKFLGMNTMDMIQKIDCPVLVIPHNTKYVKLENIVYATDYQFDDIIHAELVAKLAEHSAAKIDFVHVCTNEKNVKDDKMLMEWFKEITEQQLKYQKTEFSILVDTNTDEAIESYATNGNVDLLCVSMREKSIFQKFFSHSHTYQFVVDALVPTLVFHQEKK